MEIDIELISSISTLFFQSVFFYNNLFAIYSSLNQNFIDKNMGIVTGSGMPGGQWTVGSGDNFYIAGGNRVYFSCEIFYLSLHVGVGNGIGSFQNR